MNSAAPKAAILFADAAAYKTTSFAAKNNKPKGDDVEMTPEQIKAMEDGMKSLAESMSTITASVQSVVTEVGDIKSEITTMKAANAEAEQKTAEEQAAADLKAAQDKTTALEKELADLRAGKTTITPPEPERKTVSAANLLSKYGKGEENSATDYKTFCASVDALNLPSSESMRLKFQAKAQFEKESV